MFLKTITIILACTICSRVSGQLSIIQSPSSVKFVPTSTPLKSFELPQVIFNLFGLPNSKLPKWEGLLMGDLFKRPKAVVVVSLVTDQEITLQQSQFSFGLNKDTDLIDVDYINKRLQELDWIDPPLLVDSSVDNVLLDVKSSYDEISSTQSLEKILDDLKSSQWLENHKIGSLNIESEKDLLFLGELVSIGRTIEKIKATTLHTKNSPVFLSFQVSGLSTTSSLSDATVLLQHHLKEATVQLKKLFGDNVVVGTVATSGKNRDKLKLGRQLQQASNKSEEVTPPVSTTIAPKQSFVNFNKAPKFSSDYPVIFNIILWSSITLVLALLWISWSIWHMDPGTDSVIYRMTTQRLKRD